MFGEQSVVSWWCSNIDRLCNLPNASGETSRQNLGQMPECDKCGIKFNILRQKRLCNECGLGFCKSCIKRVSGGLRHCQKCLILSQWPVDIVEISSLRTKDLKHYLHSHHISTRTCTEKDELIRLVLSHLKKQRSSTHSRNEFSQTSTSSRPTPTPSTTNASATRSTTFSVTRDDGIRVRPTTISSASRDQGIRVFGSEAGEDGPSNVQTTLPNEVPLPSAPPLYPNIEESSTFQTSDNLHVRSLGTPSYHLSLVDIANPQREGMVRPVSPDSISMIDIPAETVQEQSDSNSTGDFVVVSMPPSQDTQVNIEENTEETVPVAVEASSLLENVGSDPPQSSEFLPKKLTGVNSIIRLENLNTDEAIKALTVRQCKEILSLHRVNYSGVKEKHELTDKVRILCKDFSASRQDIDKVPDELVCKICMDNVIDCVLLECGHTVTCVQCGKQMSECPVCRQFVVRVVRTFRA